MKATVLKEHRILMRFILLIGIVLTALVISVKPAHAATPGTSGTWSVSDDVLTIGGSGEMLEQTDNRFYPWYGYHSTIKRIVFSDSVTTVGQGAFWEFSQLEEVVFGEQMNDIGLRAFQDCPKLTKVTFKGLFPDYMYCFPDAVITANYPSWWAQDAGAMAQVNDPDHVFGAESITWISYQAEKPASLQTTPGTQNSEVQQNPQPAAPAKGTVITKGKLKYKVTTQGKYVTLYKVGKTASATVKVPATIKYNGVTYKVTAVSASAFSGCTKVTGVTIGANVKSIGSKAFNGCRSLKTIKITSKNLTKAKVKNSLYKSSVKTVKVPNAKVSAYKKYFAKSNSGKKVTVVKY